MRGGGVYADKTQRTNLEEIHGLGEGELLVRGGGRGEEKEENGEGKEGEGGSRCI